MIQEGTKATNTSLYLLCHRSQTLLEKKADIVIDMTLTKFFPSFRFVIINVELEVIDCDVRACKAIG
jgi:hypothetical protein